MKHWLKEPLLHFLLIGTGLFLLYGWGGSPGNMPGTPTAGSATEIVVSQGDLAQLVKTFERTWQRTPTESDIKNLVENFVRDEIYYREALAAGLDRDDSVIRRRLRLKMEFLLEDIAAQVEPTEQDLKTFMEQHSEVYRLDPRIGFQQVYVNADKRGRQAEADARRMLAQLKAGADLHTVGDVSLLGSHFNLAPLWEIRRRFGETFAKALLDLPQGEWVGPLRSGFGFHLVRVEQRKEARLPALQEVREAVKRDWAVARQQEVKDAAYARLRERYTVMVEPLPAEIPEATALLNTKAVTR